MNYETELIWNSHVGDFQGYIKTKIPEIAVVDCYIATNGFTGNRALLIDFNIDLSTADFKFQRFRGVEIQILHLPDKQELAVILMENSLSGVFTLLVEDMLSEMSDCSNESMALAAAFRIIGLWKRMFENLSPDGLTAEQQRGLFGELYFMRQAVNEGISPALMLESWQGPDAANQDYIINNIGVEIKATAANHASIQISNEWQLSSAHLDKLFLYLLELTERKGEALTLNSIISELRNTFGTNPALMDNFSQKLIRAGYLDEHTALYQRKDYVVRRISAFQVTTGFPKISGEDVPDGIHSITYKIEPAACDDYRIEPDNLFANLI
ncbi:PD-(D/E)XK motif protein [Mucilaginibacter sp. R-33]|uniref:PD-(D/E)XK motif protein n=1 Tax=Mucilaginibacter sp. R-33 TaxID=3416711 RepID=UPI003CED88AE